VAAAGALESRQGRDGAIGLLLDGLGVESGLLEDRPGDAVGLRQNRGQQVFGRVWVLWLRERPRICRIQRFLTRWVMRSTFIFAL